MADQHNQTITITRGVQYVADATADCGDEGNIAGWALRFRIFRRPEFAALLTLTVDNGLTILDAEAGIIRIFISPEQAAALSAGDYFWDLERTDGGELDYQIAGGPVIVLDPTGPEVSLPVCPTPVYSPSYGRVFRQELKPQRPAVVVQSGAPAAVKLFLYGPTGAPAVADSTGYCGSAAAEAKASELIAGGPQDASATVATDGTSVTIELPSGVYNCPGIYELETRVLDAAGAARAYGRCLVYVEPSGFGGWAQGPPRVDDVRMTMRDYPAANLLIGDYQFSVAEIAQAVAHTVRRFNTMPPDATNWVTTQGWPRAYWANLLDGIGAELFEIAAAYNRAGHLPYSAGGVQVDDLAKEKDYLQAANLLRMRWESWATRVKIAANIEDSFASLGGGY